MTAELRRVCHRLVLSCCGIEERRFRWVVGIVASRAVHVRPVVRVRHGCVGGKKAIAGRKKVAQRLGFSHSSVGQHRHRRMAPNAVFPLDYIIRAFPRVGLTQLGRNIRLRVGVDAVHPFGILIRVAQRARLTCGLQRNECSKRNCGGSADSSENVGGCHRGGLNEF